MIKTVYYMCGKYSYLVNITDYMICGQLTVSIDSDNGLVPNKFQVINHIYIDCPVHWRIQILRGFKV